MLYIMLCNMLYSRYLPSFCAWISPLQAALRMPVLIPRFLLELPLFVLLPKHLRKGTWTGRTITTNGIWLKVVGATLRIGSTGRDPWLRRDGCSKRWRDGSLRTSKRWRFCCATCQYRMLLIKLQAWQWRRQWRWTTKGYNAWTKHDWRQFTLICSMLHRIDACYITRHGVEISVIWHGI